ncbi:MAG TPA: hypothetical protein PKH33_01390 [bacterium]|nr:hypothetical protein [bacterium]
MSSRGPRIALVGAGGASFGPVMSLETALAEGLRGSTLVLVDINGERLEVARSAAQRMNEELGSPLTIESETDTAKGIEGADYIAMSVEAGRWERWKEDYAVPRKYGSPQDMAENGGPGGLFHSLRTINLVLRICALVEKSAPDALLINVTNPLSRVNLAINRSTKIKTIGMCPEFNLCMLRISSYLLMPRNKIAAKAAGMNHFTWIYELKNAQTGEDLFPKLKLHSEVFPFAHGKLVRSMFKKHGLYPASSDSHIGEYLPYEGENTRSNSKLFPYHKFSETECRMRVKLTEMYAKGKLRLPLRMMPRNIEGGIDVVEAAASGANAEFGSVNLPNTREQVPGLPEWAIVETPAKAANGEIIPKTAPRLPEELLNHMRLQYDIHDKIVESVLTRDPNPAFEALLEDPLSPPDRNSCKKMFDEMLALQKDALPFD